MEDMIVNKSKAIKSVIIINDDGSHEVINKGFIASVDDLENNEVSLNIRFANLNNDEVEKVLYGLSLLTK